MENKRIKYGDIYGHGTHVAGIIGAIGNNETGVAGVAWNIRLISLRIYHTGGAKNETIVQAIEYACKQNIPILNYSMGSLRKEGYAPMKASIEAYGGLFVCSAGNTSTDVDNSNPMNYPAAFDCDNMISVANCKKDGSLSSDSSYGR